MTSFSGIHGIWILDKNSRLPIVERIYSEESLEKSLLNTFFNAIISFDSPKLKKDRVDTIFMGTQMIVYDTTDNFVFISVVKREFDILDIKRILSHLRVTFIRKYPIRDCDWQFDGNSSDFIDFGPTVDEIIHHFGDSTIVLKIVLIGLDYAGKTTLTHAYADSGYHDYLPTKGLDILKINYKNMHIRLWDLGGQRQFRNLWPKFASEASGLIFVIDSTTDRWSETKEAFEIAKILNLPFICYANKQDLVDRAKSLEFIANRLVINQNLIIPGSALLNDGIYEVLDGLIQIIEDEESSKVIITDEQTTYENKANQIHELGLRFIQNFTLQGWESLTPILTELREIVNYDNLVLLKHEITSGNLKFITCDGGDTEYFRGVQYNDHIPSKVWDNKEPLFLEELNLEGNPLNLNGAAQFSMIIPIADEQNKWGLIFVHRTSNDGVSKRNVELISVFNQYLTTSFKINIRIQEF